MTELYKDPAERRPVQHDQDLATVTDRTVPDLAMPNYATTDVDPTPGSPRPVAATEPNYATTDVDPTPGSPRPDDGQDLSGSAAHPAVGTVRLNITPDRGRRTGEPLS